MKVVEVLKTGKTYETDFSLNILFENGKVKSVESLMDTLAVARAFGTAS